MITLSIPIALNASPAAVQQLLLLANEVAGFPTKGGAPTPSQTESQPAALMQSDALVQDSASASVAASPVEDVSEAPGAAVAPSGAAPGAAVAPSGDAPVKRRPGRPPGTTKSKLEAVGTTPPPQQMLSNGAVERGSASIVPQNPAMPPSTAGSANSEISREDLAAVWEAANEHNKPEAINLMRGTTLPNGDPKPKWFTPAQVPEPFISRMYHELVALLPTA